jgi:hypothetical protein
MLALVDARKQRLQKSVPTIWIGRDTSKNKPFIKKRQNMILKNENLFTL